MGAAGSEPSLDERRRATQASFDAFDPPAPTPRAEAERRLRERASCHASTSASAWKDLFWTFANTHSSYREAFNVGAILTRRGLVLPLDPSMDDAMRALAGDAGDVAAFLRSVGVREPFAEAVERWQKAGRVFYPEVATRAAGEAAKREAAAAPLVEVEVGVDEVDE
jgi:hypothetical protein